MTSVRMENKIWLFFTRNACVVCPCTLYVHTRLSGSRLVTNLLHIWKHCCNKVVFQISHKNGMGQTIPEKKGEGDGAVNIELTGVSKMKS